MPQELPPFRRRAAEAARLLTECVDHVRAGSGPALVRLTVPRLCNHSGPDNQRAYRTDAEMEAEIEDFIEGFNHPTWRGMRVNR